MRHMFLFVQPGRARKTVWDRRLDPPRAGRIHPRYRYQSCCNGTRQWSIPEGRHRRNVEVMFQLGVIEVGLSLQALCAWGNIDLANFFVGTTKEREQRYTKGVDCR